MNGNGESQNGNTRIVNVGLSIAATGTVGLLTFVGWYMTSSINDLSDDVGDLKIESAEMKGKLSGIEKQLSTMSDLQKIQNQHTFEMENIQSKIINIKGDIIDLYAKLEQYVVDRWRKSQMGSWVDELIERNSELDIPKVR